MDSPFQIIVCITMTLAGCGAACNTCARGAQAQRQATAAENMRQAAKLENGLLIVMLVPMVLKLVVYRRADALGAAWRAEGRRAARVFQSLCCTAELQPVRRAKRGEPARATSAPDGSVRAAVVCTGRCRATA